MAKPTPPKEEQKTMVLPAPDERLKRFGTLRVAKPKNSEVQVEEEWVAIQRQVFENWVKYHLSKRPPLVFKDLRKDFSDGTQLVALLEILSKQNVSHNRNPKTKFQKIENVNKAIDFMKQNQVVFRGFGAEDIVDTNNPKVPLALVWSLLQKFQVNVGRKDDDLLKWVNERLSPYGQQRKDFESPSWNDGIALSYLVNLYVPQSNLVDQLTNDNIDNLAKAFTIAEQELGIPTLFHPEDLAACKIDDKSIKAYISFFRLLEEQNPDFQPGNLKILDRSQRTKPEEKPAPPPESPRDPLNQLLREIRHRMHCLVDNDKKKELKDKKVTKTPEYAMKQATKQKTALEAIEKKMKDLNKIAEENKELKVKLDAETEKSVKLEKNLAEEKDKAKLQKENYEKEIQQLKEKLAAQQAQSEEQRKKDEAKIKALEEKIKALESALADRDKQLEAAKKREKELQDKLAESAKETLEAQKRFEKQLKEKDDKIKDLEAQLLAVKNKEKILEIRVVEIKGDTEQANDRAKLAELKLAQAESKNKLQEEMIEKLLKQGNQGDTGADVLKYKIEQLEKELEQERNKVNDLLMEIDKLKALLNEKEKKILDLNRQLEQQALQSQNEINKLKDKLNIAEKENEDLRNQLEKERNAKLELQKELDRLKDLLAQKERMINDLKRQLDNLEKEKADLLKQLEREKNALNAMKRQNQDLESELANLRNMKPIIVEPARPLMAAPGEVDELKAQINDLQQRLALARAPSVPVEKAELEKLRKQNAKLLKYREIYKKAKKYAKKGQQPGYGSSKPIPIPIYPYPIDVYSSSPMRIA